jgi:hypothetical protein
VATEGPNEQCNAGDDRQATYGDNATIKTRKSLLLTPCSALHFQRLLRRAPVFLQVFPVEVPDFDQQANDIFVFHKLIPCMALLG